MMMPIVEFRGVSKWFGDKQVLERVNLSIHKNQITTLIGKSGTGKSVLLKHIVGLLHPDEGEIFLDGVSMIDLKKTGKWRAHQSRISYMFQDNALFDAMTVFDNVALPLRQTTKLKTGEIEKRVMDRIEQVELGGVIHNYPSEISAGMQKRTALARALVTDPQMVLFDEPTTGQDLVRRNRILSMIAHYKKHIGFTAVLISHDIPDVFFISDRIVMLWEKTVVFEGTGEAAARFDHPMIREIRESLAEFQEEFSNEAEKQRFASRYAGTFLGMR